MGTKFAPVYVTLVLAYLEEIMYNQSETEFDSDFRAYLESNFKRYLDDCFMIFTRTKEEQEKFHEFLNTLHPCIKFTIDKNRIWLRFLDTLIISHNEQLQSDIFYKPADSKQYRLYTSCHPKHTRNGIPYNLARRLKMIISEENTLLTRLEELKSYLLKQKYPPNLIDDSIRKIKSLNRADLLRENKMNDKENSLIPYVTTFNPHNPEIYPEIRHNKAIIKRWKTENIIFKDFFFQKVNASHQT